MARTSRNLIVLADGTAAQTGFPTFFILIVAWLAVSGLNLGLYNLRSLGGAFCEAGRDKNPISICNNRYQFAMRSHWSLARCRFSIPHPNRAWGRRDCARDFEKKPEYAWFDKGVPADVVGIGIDSPHHMAAMLLKRWWRENYFQSIARVGNIGKYEYPLHPVAPLPKVDFSACKKISQASPDDIESLGPVSQWDAELACEEEKKIERNEVLIADITPDSTGELYIYVNDAVLFWDSRDHHKFYKNNRGKAKVTVWTVAPATVNFNSAEAGQPQQRN